MSTAATVRKHYIKVKSSLLAKGVKAQPSANWFQSVFDDVTHSGTRIAFEEVKSGAKSRYRVGLYGDKYYCEACPDAFFEDTLYICKVLAARNQPLGTRQYSAQFQRRPNGSAMKLDLIGTFAEFLPCHSEPPRIEAIISAVAASNDPALSDIEQEIAGAQGRFSRSVVEALACAPQDIRKLWRPRIVTRPWDMTEVKKPWLKFQLSKYRVPLPVDPQPAQLSAAYFASSFNSHLINAFVRNDTNSQNMFYELLRSIVEFPIEVSLRTKIWASMLSGLDGNKLLRELRDTADDFLLFSASESQPWQAALLMVIQYQARKSKDPWFESLLADANGQKAPLQYIANWAKTFQFGASAQF